jgi:hypothetical protein
MRLKEEYINYMFTHNGSTYTTATFKEENFKRIWDVNPDLRYLFEDTEKDFFKNKPEDKTEEEFFNETIKKATKRKPKQ